MVRQEMPASIEQSELFVLVTMCCSPLSYEINKKGVLANLYRMQPDRVEAVYSEASLTLETFGDPRTTNTKQR